MHIRAAARLLACLTLPVTAATPCLAQPASLAPGSPNCIDVQVGSAQSYDCINAQLGAVARNAPRNSADTDAPVTSSSPSNVVGTFNAGATANRLGRNFGHSAVPYRPPVVNPPILPPR